MKTIILYISLAILLIGNNLYAQNSPCGQADCNLTNNLNVSTGINASGSELPAGSIDPFWQLMNIAPYDGTQQSGIQVPDAYVVNIFSGSVWNNIDSAGILSALNTSSFSHNNLNAAQPWRFRRQFCVCTTTEIRIKGNFRADDSGTLRIVSSTGQVIFTFALAPGSTLTNFNSNHYFDTTAVFPAGIYFAETDIINVAAVAMGFTLNLRLLSTNQQNVLSNPSQDCCKKLDIITGQIEVDNNCDDTTDVMGTGWTVNLMSSGSVVQTTTSNNFGEFSFNNLADGVYSVVPVNPSGVSLPAQIVTVPSAGSVHFIHVNSSTCDSVQPELCCDISSVNVNFYEADNVYKLELSTGNTPVQEVEIAVVDYHIEYSDPACKPDNIGVFGNLTTSTVNLSTLHFDPASNNSSVLLWNTGTPALLNNKEILLNITKPDVLHLKCCEMKFNFCVKVTVKDINCNVCEIIVCPLPDWEELEKEKVLKGVNDPVNLALNEGREKMSRTKFGVDVETWYAELKKHSWIREMLKKHPEEIRTLLKTGRKLIQEKGTLDKADLDIIEKTLRLIDKEFVKAPGGFIEEALRRLRSSTGKKWDQIINELAR